MRFLSIAPLAESVVSLADLKEHCRAYGDDDDVVASAGLAASEWVEQWTQRLLASRTITMELFGLPMTSHPLELPGGIVTAVASVVAEGDTLTGYTFAGDSPAYLFPATEWPVVDGTGLPVAVTYTAGYTTVPEPLLMAVKLIAAELYDQRRQGTEAQMRNAPVSAEYLMARYRIRPF